MPQPAAEPRYAVYHARDPWAMLFPHADRWLDHQALHFRHVADVQADELDQVFALTNHQEEESWTSHREIVWHASDAPVRSTSVLGLVSLCRIEGALKRDQSTANSVVDLSYPHCT